LYVCPETHTGPAQKENIFAARPETGADTILQIDLHQGAKSEHEFWGFHRQDAEMGFAADLRG
jgi:hypothetical protein